MLRVREVEKTFPPNLKILDKVTFSIRKNEFISIIGPTGCGKTTLLRIIAGLIKDYQGKIEFENNNLKIGMVFQDLGLFPWMSVLKNIEIGLEVEKIPKHIRREMVKKYIEKFGLIGFENRYPKELSGGMKQKVAIARTLITDPDLVLMDEPFASLDAYTRKIMQDFLLDIWLDKMKTILFVTHNVEEALLLSDKIILFSQRPAKVINIFEVSLDRPRDITNRSFLKIKEEILKNLYD